MHIQQHSDCTVHKYRWMYHYVSLTFECWTGNGSSVSNGNYNYNLCKSKRASHKLSHKKLINFHMFTPFLK